MRTAWLAGLVATGLIGSAAAQGNHRIGAGANYWVAMDNIDIDDIDDDGFSYLVSYQHRGRMLGLGIDAEMMPDRFGEDAYAGQAYLIVGSGVYAAAGVGIVRVDGDFADDPFFSLRAGLDVEALPSLRLDLSVQYRFDDISDLEDSETNIDTDTLFLGAALRLAF